MSQAFEVTRDDIENVLSNYGVAIPAELPEIDDMRVTDAALAADLSSIEDGDDDGALSIQTDVAYDEIARQLVESGHIARKEVARYGNDTLLAVVATPGDIQKFGSLDAYKEALYADAVA